MVKKLKLPTQSQPQPYKLQWLNDESEVLVNQQCLIAFSMDNKCHDEVWCDVIPMDACHLLLGRPWQYDRRVTYDGFENTYSFIKDEVKIKLIALPLDKFNRVKGQRSMMIASRTFHRTRIKKGLRLEDKSFSNPGRTIQIRTQNKAQKPKFPKL
jgi:hypothetical protein